MRMILDTEYMKYNFAVTVMRCLSTEKQINV